MLNLICLNGHKLKSMFNGVNKILSAGPTHSSNLAKILLQHFLKMDPPTTAFVPSPVTTAQGICSNLTSRFFWGYALGISCKWLLIKIKIKIPKYLLPLNYISSPLFSVKPEAKAPLPLSNLHSGYHSVQQAVILLIYWASLDPC